MRKQVTEESSNGKAKNGISHKDEKLWSDSAP